MANEYGIIEIPYTYIIPLHSKLNKKCVHHKICPSI